MIIYKSLSFQWSYGGRNNCAQNPQQFRMWRLPWWPHLTHFTSLCLSFHVWSKARIFFWTKANSWKLLLRGATLFLIQSENSSESPSLDGHSTKWKNILWKLVSLGMLVFWHIYPVYLVWAWRQLSHLWYWLRWSPYFEARSHEA